MYTDEDLNLAVTEGIVSAEAVAAVRAHVLGRRSVANYADDEHFRLLTGFNDVFVVIASALLLLSVGWMSHVWRRGLAHWRFGYFLDVGRVFRPRPSYGSDGDRAAAFVPRWHHSDDLVVPVGVEQRGAGRRRVARLPQPLPFCTGIAFRFPSRWPRRSA